MKCKNIQQIFNKKHFLLKNVVINSIIIDKIDKSEWSEEIKDLLRIILNNEDKNPTDDVQVYDKLISQFIQS